MLTHDKISRIKCHIIEIVFTIFFRNQTGFGRQEQGRNYKYSNNARESIGTAVINSKHLQTSRDYSLVGSLDAISGLSSRCLVALTIYLSRFEFYESGMQIAKRASPGLSKVQYWTNQRPFIQSSDHSRPIRGQYPMHMITLDQSEARTQYSKE